jgi:hypothetical protein
MIEGIFGAVIFGRVRGRVQAKLGKDGGIWTSVAGAHSAGRALRGSSGSAPRCVVRA